MRGELAFERLLRVDGTFEGQLSSSGSLLVGPTGLVVGPVLGLKAVVCEGTIRGAVAADKVMLGPGARLEGDVTARRVVCEEGAVLLGRWNVHRQAPSPIVVDDLCRIVRPPEGPGEGAGDDSATA